MSSEARKRCRSRQLVRGASERPRPGLSARVQGLHTPTGPLAAGGLPCLLGKVKPQCPAVLPAGWPAVPALTGVTWMSREGRGSREAVSGTRRAQEASQRVRLGGCLPPSLQPPPWGASFSSAAGQGRESPDPSSELCSPTVCHRHPGMGTAATPTRGAVGPGQAWCCWGTASRTPVAPGKGPAVLSAPRKTSLTISKPKDRSGLISHSPPPLLRRNPLTWLPTAQSSEIWSLNLDHPWKVTGLPRCRVSRQLLEIN